MKTAFVIPFYGAAIGGGAESQCRMLAENLQKRGVDVEIITTRSEDNTQAAFSIKLIGMRLNDAIACLEKQMDAAVIRGLKEFSVVHGKGDGILQKGVHNYLKQCPFVADYFFSTPELGGFGRTVVVLKC